MYTQNADFVINASMIHGEYGSTVRQHRTLKYNPNDIKIHLLEHIHVFKKIYIDVE